MKRSSTPSIVELSNRFRIVSPMSDGRHASVFLAEDRVASRRVALKLPRDRSPAETSARLVRESDVLRRVNHPNVQQILDFGTTSDGTPFLVTQFENGQTLDKIIAARGRISEGQVCTILSQLLGALQAVHAAGALHGDVTPKNCVCVGFSSTVATFRLCLIDFGGGRWLDSKLGPHTIGTPLYMAPELATAAPSVASDLYAVGVIAYELLLGVPPFRASTNTEILWQHAHEPVRRPRESDPGISPTLEAAILRALAKDPSRRFGSAAEFASALDRVANASANAHAHVQTERADQDERGYLIQRVREQWIEGVLARTTDGVVLVRQRLTAQHTERLEATSIVAAYTASTDGLLILGDAGHGKTVNLLRLARHVADHATEADGTIGAIPVVFSLSSWTVDDSDFQVWMRRELASKYLLPARASARLIDSGEFVPMLDGLDDVPPEARSACVHAINTFGAGRAKNRVVVSCRTDEYASTRAKLDLQHTVVLEALATADITQQLEQSASRELARALRSNTVLAELSRTPMLLHVMRMAFRDSFEFRGALASHDEAVEQLFESFVSNALGKLALAQRAGFEKTMSAVARLLSRTSRVLLLFEEVQPAWLPTDGDLVLYAVLSRAVVALLFCASIVPAVAFSPLENDGFHVSPAFALRLASLGALWLTVLFGGVAARSLLARNSERARTLSAVAAVAIGAVATGGSVFAMERHPIGFVIGAEVGVVGGLLLGVSRRNQGTGHRDVVTADRISWSLGNVGASKLAALFAVATAVFAVAHALDGAQSAGYMAWAVVAIGVGVLGHRARSSNTRITANIGMWHTGRNALLVGVAVFTLTTFSFALGYGVPYAACVGLTLATIGALWFGGIDVINHGILRWLLHRRGALPFAAARSLDDAVELGLMRRSGNGYLFMHAMLLRHLEAKP